MKNYIKKIRKKIGQSSFIHPAARIIIENEKNEILFIEKADTGQLGLPAGAFEEGETIEECIKREVEEETGLIVKNVVVIGISSNPRTEKVEYPNGDKIQYFTVEFYANEWEGAIKIQDTNEIKAAKFRHKSEIKRLPKNELSTFDSLDFYRKNHQIMLK